MTTPSRVPSPKQEHLAGLGLINVLVLAPAGCGKTEALALRAVSVCSRGIVRQPRRVLAVTFSNKAKDNLATRVRSAMGTSWREAVTVANFHGLAGRIVRAHGQQIGVNGEVTFPEKAWRAKALRELVVSWQDGDVFEKVLRLAKADVVDDDVVMQRLLATGHRRAIAFEERLREESRLDYDDLLRHAARLLAIPAVRRLYQEHFSMVMVDEVQDLTMMQLGLVEAIGANGITYAGDPAQGIYSFAGAEPDAVFAAIRAREPAIVELDESYRSSPAVLRAVNVLAAQLGTTKLQCAEPSKWPDIGHVVIVRRTTQEEEARAVADIVRSIVQRDGTCSVGIVVRRLGRMQTLKSALEREGQPFEDWSAPTHVPWIAELLRTQLPEALNSSDDVQEQLAALERSCRARIEEADAPGHDDVTAACEDLRTLVDDGMSVRDAVNTCRTSSSPDKPVVPGAHLLNGHLGKGQEFDWVIVVGLENGHIPDFRASSTDDITEELRGPRFFS